MKKTPEAILSISAIIIAIVSIFISIWEGSLMREHYHLSVVPRLEYSYSIHNKTVGFVLKNKGLGPAIITSVDYYMDEKILDQTKNHFSILILNALDMKIPTTFDSIGKQKTIEAGEEIDLFILHLLGWRPIEVL